MATSFLRAQGIEASLADGVLATVDPMLWRAMGGLRVMVPASQEATARDLLTSVRAGDFEIEGEPPEPERRGPVLTLGVLLGTLVAPNGGGLVATAAGRRRPRLMHWIGWAVLAALILLPITVWTAVALSEGAG